MKSVVDSTDWDIFEKHLIIKNLSRDILKVMREIILFMKYLRDGKHSDVKEFRGRKLNVSLECSLKKLCALF